MIDTKNQLRNIPAERIKAVDTALDLSNEPTFLHVLLGRMPSGEPIVAYFYDDFLSYNWSKALKSLDKIHTCDDFSFMFQYRTSEIRQILEETLAQVAEEFNDESGPFVFAMYHRRRDLMNLICPESKKYRKYLDGF